MNLRRNCVPVAAAWAMSTALSLAGAPTALATQPHEAEIGSIEHAAPISPTSWTFQDLGAVADDLGYQPSGDRGWGSLAVNKQRIAVAWNDERVDDEYVRRDSDIELRQSSDGGETWDPLLNLSHDDQKVTWLPDVDTSLTSTVVVYGKNGSCGCGPEHVDLVRVGANGSRSTAALGTPEGLNGTFVSHPRIAGNSDGAYHIAYGRGYDGAVVVHSSTEDGRTWPSGVALATTARQRPGAALIPNPSIGADDATVAVGWSQLPSVDSVKVDPVIRTSTDGGATWGGLQALATTPVEESSPAVAVRGSRIVAVWLTFRSASLTTLDSATSMNAGLSWTPPSTVASWSEAIPQPGSSDMRSVDMIATPAGFAAFTGFKQSIFTSVDGTSWADPIRRGPGLSIGSVDGSTFLESAGSFVYTPTFATAPSSPSAVTGIPSDGAATVSWSAPNDGGSPITKYVVTSRPEGKSCATSGATTCTVTELANGTDYTFTVTAINAIGESAPSEPSSPVVPAAAVVTPTPATEPTPTPATEPPAQAPVPTGPVATAPSRMNAPKVVVRNRTAIIRWIAATSNGSPIKSYVVDVSKGRDKTTRASARRTTFKRLKPGRYTFRIAAKNNVGTSAFSRRVKIRIR